ncbi:MAG: hypothetical protein AAGK01_10440, partial [Pseudomonadota bacterium]
MVIRYLSLTQHVAALIGACPSPANAVMSYQGAATGEMTMTTTTTTKSGSSAEKSLSRRQFGAM